MPPRTASRAGRSAAKTDELASRRKGKTNPDENQFAGSLVTDHTDVPESTPEEAKERAEQIRGQWNTLFDSHDSILVLVTEARERRDDQALGYGSFAEYVDGEYGLEKLPRLTGEMRTVWSQSLAAAGMSTREIAPIVGASHMTVATDLRKGDDDVKNNTGEGDGPVTNPKPRGAAPKCQHAMDFGKKCKVPKTWDTDAPQDNGSLGGWVGHDGDHEADPEKAPSAAGKTTGTGRAPLPAQVVKAVSLVTEMVEGLTFKSWKEKSRQEVADTMEDASKLLHERALAIRKGE